MSHITQLSFQFAYSAPQVEDAPVLDEPAMRQLFARALDHCSALHPLKRWRHQPQGLLLDNARQRIGCAFSDGKIQVTRHFIGTREFDFLWDTYLHELAHLAAGIRHGHGPRWQSLARCFGCDTRATARLPVALLAQARPRWQLWAALVSGELVLLRQVHRRSRRYLAARPGDYLVNGLPVMYFEYREEA